MKKFNSFAFYALVAPVLTIAAGAVVAQQPVGQDIDRAQQSTQRDQDDTQSNPTITQNTQNIPRDSQSNPAISQTGSQTGQNAQRGSQPSSTAAPDNQGTSRANQSQGAANQSPTGAAHSDARSQSGMQHRGYIATAPENGMQLSELMGAEVSTAREEDVGSVDELIIDENGQIVAIVVGVGGFLGMAEKDVAIGWGHVTRSGTAGDQELRIDVTGDELRAAPAFERE